VSFCLRLFPFAWLREPNRWYHLGQTFLKCHPMVNILFFNQIWRSFTLKLPEGGHQVLRVSLFYPRVICASKFLPDCTCTL